MKLVEIFQSYTESDNSTDTIIKIPTQIIEISPDSISSLTDNQKNKVEILSNRLKNGTLTPTSPIQVKKLARSFQLIDGLVKFLAYKRAGIYAIPAKVINDAQVTEERQRYIVYLNDKPVAYFEKKSDADTQVDVVKKRYPDANIKVELGIVKN